MQPHAVVRAADPRKLGAGRFVYNASGLCLHPRWQPSAFGLQTIPSFARTVLLCTLYLDSNLEKVRTMEKDSAAL